MLEQICNQVSGGENRKKMNKFEIDIAVVKTNTMSPNGKFFYKIQEPKAINPSAFAVKAFFLSIKNNSLIYFNSKALLHELHNKEDIQDKLKQMWDKKDFDQLPKSYTLDFVWWSAEGNMCYFIEYKIENNFTPSYTFVFLNLEKQMCYRIPETDSNFIDKFNLKDKCYDEKQVEYELNNRSNEKYLLIKDKIPSQSFLETLFDKKKWYPK